MKKAAFVAGWALAIGLSLIAQPRVPRPDVPDPQFQRPAWVNLNGPWQFEFDDGNVGLDQGWASGSRPLSRTILVPFCFESRASGIRDTSFHPWTWYRRSFTLPADWKGRRVLLNFGAVNYRAIVWINGARAGDHEGGNTPIHLDITPLVKAGENTVTVRTEFPPTDRSIPRGKQFWEPASRSIFYTRTSGIWQTVWLEATGESYLREVRTVPGREGTVRFDAFVERPQAGLEVQATISDGQSRVGLASGEVRDGHGAAAAVILNPKRWSPGSPNLYDVTFELRKGTEVLDTVRSYFGFRSVGVRNDRITLDGSPIYLRMVLDQGYWPDSVLTPPSDEAIQYDIRMTKEMGFNGARKHQKVADPLYLYWADKMGLLVSGEMANAYVFDEAYVRRFTREWMEAVARDQNHPSIVIWAPINESWGTPDLEDRRQQQHLQALYATTHSLDGTRLVIDNEGWEHTDATDLFALHDYARTGDELYEKFKDLGKPGARIPDVGEPPLAPGFKYNGSPFYLSEFGGIAFIPPGHQVPKQAWGYAGVEKTPDAALERMRGLYAAIAKLPFAGLCYTQLTDVEQEVNGLMTFDRKPKFDPKVIRGINALAK